MRKILVGIFGHDRPGIIAAVSGVLFEHGCNIEDVSQTILQSEFCGTFIATIPRDRHLEELLESLRQALDPMGLSVLLRLMEDTGVWDSPPSEPFVITTLGPDRLGLVAGITGLLADYGINITNLKAVFRGGENPTHNTMIYEVDIPNGIDQNRFREALYKKGEELGIEISVQHRKIFEAIHRI